MLELIQAFRYARNITAHNSIEWRHVKRDVYTKYYWSKFGDVWVWSALPEPTTDVLKQHKGMLIQYRMYNKRLLNQAILDTFSDVKDVLNHYLDMSIKDTEKG